MPIKKYITHEFEGLAKVQELIDTLHGGDCLRGVLHISDYQVPKAMAIRITNQVKLHGGALKTVQHWSEVNQCDMTFNIYLPEDNIRLQRNKGYPVLYFLSGLTCNQQNFVEKSGFAKYAREHKIAVVVCDTSPRNTDLAEANEHKWEAQPYANWCVGYGAGHYVDATAEPWNKHFNMYSYVTKELPQIVNEYFPVDPASKSIFGHSMGGNGALVVALRNAKEYRSVSAFAPLSAPLTSVLSAEALRLYLQGPDW